MSFLSKIQWKKMSLDSNRKSTTNSYNNNNDAYNSSYTIINRTYYCKRCNPFEIRHYIFCNLHAINDCNISYFDKE